MWAPGPVSLHQMSTIEFNALLFQVYLCDHAAYVAHLWAPRGLAACLGRSAHLNPNYHWIWLKKSVNDAVCSNSGSNSLIFPLRWYCTQDWTNIRCYWNNINIHQLQELSKTFFFKANPATFWTQGLFPFFFARSAAVFPVDVFCLGSAPSCRGIIPKRINNGPYRSIWILCT